VTRYLLDTNIISDVVKPQPSGALIEWLGDQADEDLCIATWTLAEVRRGILQMPTGRRRSQFEAWFSGPQGPPRLFAGRILNFDEQAAEAWAGIMADGHLNGRPRSALDMIIAAVALANDCTLVTDNERHFAGVIPFLNPMR
jgi:predicted nucleic acid-binding protein